MNTLGDCALDGWLWTTFAVCWFVTDEHAWWQRARRMVPDAFLLGWQVNTPGGCALGGNTDTPGDSGSGGWLLMYSTRLKSGHARCLRTQRMTSDGFSLVGQCTRLVAARSAGYFVWLL